MERGSDSAEGDAVIDEQPAAEPPKRQWISVEHALNADGNQRCPVCGEADRGCVVTDDIPRSWLDEADEQTRFLELDEDGNLTGRDKLAPKETGK
jgi:hypothetical protein